MANVQAPYGLQVWDGFGNSAVPRLYKKKSGTAIYQGDVVIATGDGEVTIAASGDRVLGVAAESKESAFAGEMLIYDNPHLVFDVQCEGDFELADIFLNANIVANAANTALSRSKHSLDSDNAAITATHQFKIIGLIDQGTNAVGSYARVKVIPNHHEFKDGTAGTENP